MFETKSNCCRKTHLQLRRQKTEIANEAINKTVEFFHKMGMDTKLSDYTKEYDATADFM
jgi:NADP-dependent alcohol dehydrogenase